VGGDDLLSCLLYRPCLPCILAAPHQRNPRAKKGAIFAFHSSGLPKITAASCAERKVAIIGEGTVLSALLDRRNRVAGDQVEAELDHGGPLFLCPAGKQRIG